MSIKRNWMIYLSLFIYLAASLLILSFGLEQFQEIEQTYLVKTILIIGFFAVYIVINILFYLFTRPILLKLGSHLRVLKYIVEGLLILAILGGGVALRLYFLNSYPVGMESDYKFYYDVAIMIKEGTLTTLSNNEYISLFPHTYGYCYILSLVMRVFGTDPSICYYTNIVFSVITALFCYGIGRRIAGRVAGISALAISFFWPSQIIFSNINGAEAAFTCFLYGAAYLCLMSMQIKEDTKLGTSRIILRHVICGILIALASAIRPMGLVLLIAFVICLLSINKKLKYKSIMDVSLKTILLSKGFLRAIFVLLGYFIASQLISAGVAQAIEKDIASGGAMGYSLMVGTNIASDGGYSEDTMNFLYDAYEETESANAANDASMEVAIRQIKDNPTGILELFAKKFYLVWSNDDYATTTNIVTMNNQLILTMDRESLFYDLADFNNVFYLFVVFLSAIGVIFLIRKDNEASLFAIFFIGTIALFLLVEMQNRYHYFALQSIAILAAGGIGFTYEFYRQRSELRISNKLMLLADVELAAGVVEEKVKEGTELDTSEGASASTTAASKMNTIDVIKAIQEGHIRITATQAYQGDEVTSTGEVVIVPDATKVEDEVVVNEAASVDEMSVVDEAASMDEMSVVDEAASVDEVSVVDEAASVDEMLVVDEAASVDEMSVVDEAASVDEMSVVEEAASMDELSVVEEAVSMDELSVVDEAVSFHEISVFKEPVSIDELPVINEVKEQIELNETSIINSDSSIESDIDITIDNNQEETNLIDVEVLEQLAAAIELAVAKLKVKKSIEAVDLNKVVKQNNELTTNKNTVANQTMTSKVVNNGAKQVESAIVNKTNNANRVSTIEKRATSSNQSTQKRTTVPKKNVSTGTKRYSDDIIKNVIDGLLNQRSKSSKKSENTNRNKGKQQGKMK